MESELERVARMCFEHSLGEMFPEERVALRLSDDDPPDYSFDLGGASFAAEATSIHHLVKVADKKRRPAMNVEAAAKKIERQLREACEGQGVPHGFYVVDLGIPLCKPKERDCIIEPSLEYIHRTREVETAEPEDIWPPPRLLPDGSEYQLRDHPIATICKYSMTYNLVQVIQPPRGASICVAQDEAVTMLDDVLWSKAGKLRTKGIPKPWILLVLHRHPFVAHTYYRERLLDLHGLAEFHSVFVARNEQNGYLLSSRWYP